MENIFKKSGNLKSRYKKVLERIRIVDNRVYNHCYIKSSLKDCTEYLLNIFFVLDIYIISKEKDIKGYKEDDYFIITVGDADKLRYFIEKNIKKTK